MGLFDKLFGKKDKEEIKEQVNKEKEDIFTFEDDKILDF